MKARKDESFRQTTIHRQHLLLATGEDSADLLTAPHQAWDMLSDALDVPAHGRRNLGELKIFVERSSGMM